MRPRVEMGIRERSRERIAGCRALRASDDDKNGAAERKYGLGGKWRVVEQLGISDNAADFA